MLRAGFDRIGEAARRLRADQSRDFLTISAGATFAVSWLVRRLGQFSQAHGDIEVRLQTSDETIDFVRDGVDIAIRFGAGVYPGLAAIRLFDEEIFPVCSPRLPKPDRLLSKPGDLAGHTLLHVEWSRHEGETLDWEMWLRAAGAGDVDASRGPRCSHTSMALHAAIEGQGLALGSESLARDDLASGRLIRPFEVTLPVNFAYYLVYPEETADRPKIAAFRHWIRAEISAEMAA